MARTSPKSSAIVDELLLEGMGGPDIDYVVNAARQTYLDTYRGASLKADFDRLVKLLMNKKAFYAKHKRARLVRKWLVKALLHHALATDAPALVTKLRGACATQPDAALALFQIDYRKRISPRCLEALLDGVDREPLAARDEAMHLLRSYAHVQRIGPVLDVVVAELAAREEGRGYKRAAPAESASRTLVEWAFTARDRDADALASKLEAIASSKVARADREPARATLAAILTTRGKLDALEALAEASSSNAGARSAVLAGIDRAIGARASREEDRRKVPAVPKLYERALSTMASLAKSKPDRKLLDKARARLEKHHARAAASTKRAARRG